MLTSWQRCVDVLLFLVVIPTHCSDSCSQKGLVPTGPSTCGPVLLKRVKAESMGDSGQWLTTTLFKLNNGINIKAEVLKPCLYAVNHTFSTYSTSPPPHLLQKNRTRMMDITQSCIEPNCSFSSRGAKINYYYYLFYCLIHFVF